MLFPILQADWDSLAPLEWLVLVTTLKKYNKMTGANMVFLKIDFLRFKSEIILFRQIKI